MPDILMNEIDADGDKPDHHFDGHTVENSTVEDEIEVMEVIKQFARISRAAMSKEWSQLSISRRPLM